MTFRRPRWSRVLAFAVAVGLLTFPGGAAPAAERPAPTNPQRWIIVGFWWSRIEELQPDVTNGVLREPPTIVLGSWSDRPNPHAFAWASYAQFASELDPADPAYRGAAFWSSIDTVMYDPERWEFTPEDEQRDPATYVRAFAELGHANGYQVVATPHPNLVTVDGGSCTRLQDESEWTAFLRCGLLRDIAPLVDVIEVQGQKLETDPVAYRAFVSSATAQARAANLDVLVVSGLSTAYITTPDELDAAWRAVQDIVDGHYMAVIKPWRVPLVTSFLAGLPVPRV